MEITNDGVFRPGLYKDDDRRRRGMGLPLMVSLADQIHVSRQLENKTRVSLTFFLQSEAADTIIGRAAAPEATIAQLEAEHLKLQTALIKAERAEAETQRLLRAVQDEKERLTRLVDSITDEVWFADTNQVYTLANAAALQELAVDAAHPIGVEELAQKSEVYRSDMSSRPVEEAPPVRAFAGEVVRNQEEIVRTPGSGELRHRLVNATPVRDAMGGIVGVVSVVRDITERKRSEDVLRESEQAARAAEERYRELFNTLIEGFCIIEVIFDERDNPVDYRFLETNPKFEEQTGLHDVQGKLMRELAPNNDEYWYEFYGKVAVTGEPARFQARSTPLGRHYDVSAYRVGVSESRQVGILFNDITERKQAEEELRGSEERFRTMADAIPQLAWIANADGYIYWYNRRWHEYTGTSLAEMEGWGWQSVHDPDALPGVLERWQESIATGEPFDMEFPLRGADGEFRPFLTRVMPQKDAHGRVLEWFGTNTDLSERAGAERHLRAHALTMQGITKILEAALTTSSEQQLGDVCLEVAEHITASKFGFIGELGLNGRLYDITISNPGWEACQITNAAGHRLPPGEFKVHGIYGRVLADGKSLVANDPSSHPDSIGLPPGHPPLTAFLGVPLKNDGEIIGMVAVGNREGGYDPEQQEALEALAPVIVEAFSRKRAEAALRKNDARLGLALRSANVSAYEVDREQRYVWIHNPHPGAAGKDLTGLTSADVSSSPVVESLVALRAQVMETGELMRREFALPLYGDTRTYDYSMEPVRDESGEISGVLVAAADVTERTRALAQEQELAEELAAANEELQSQNEEIAAQAEELEAPTNEEIRVAHEELAILYEHEHEDARLKAALAQIDQTLIASLEHAEILDRALENGARAFGAERAVLEVRTPTGWEVRSVYRLPVELVGTLLSPEEASVATAMEEAGGVLVIQDAAEDPRVNASTVARYGTTAVLALPISYQNRTMGSLRFLYASGPHRFSAAEIDFGQRLAVSAALALENARLFEQQRSIADALQQTILEMPAAIPHLRFSHLYRSATEYALVGGDFYDVFEMEDESIALLVGDVSGHDINAARIATMVKASLVAFAHGSRDPSNVLALVNQLLVRKSVPGFTSLLFAVLQPESGMLTYCSAGHPDILVGRAGKVEGLAAPRHTPLGVFSDWSCASECVQLEPGDTLLFYTDGLTEARQDGELFGEKRLVRAFNRKLHLPLEKLPEALLDDVLAFTGGNLQDDVAILAVQPRCSSSPGRD